VVAVSLRQHEIAEAEHRILNPFTDDKLMLLGEVCRLRAGHRLLDLACGKGEMLCRWADRFGTGGVGVDISEVFLAAARARADELGVAGRVRFVHADAARFLSDPPAGEGSARYDVVSCIGATWIGGGLVGTIGLMRAALRRGGLMLVGEPYWTEDPPPAAQRALGFTAQEVVSLADTAQRASSAGMELVEMVLADAGSWDRYVAAQWWTVSAWLRANPDHPEAPGMREFLADSRDSHLAYGRRYLGWGVFVLREA
jgi:SAM-dependent methyltransferase